MTQLHDLSNEVLLQIFPHCPLKSLIAAHGVSTLWRQFVPLADISPPRRGLLDFYFAIIESPAFQRSRPWLLENLCPFDREAYIDTLLDQHDYLPEDFRIWILEWPAKAVIACCWPGLPHKYYGAEETDEIERMCGCNSLGKIPPVVHTMVFRRSEEVEVDVPALLVWENEGSTYLALQPRPTCAYAVYDLPDATPVRFETLEDDRDELDQEGEGNDDNEEEEEPEDEDDDDELDDDDQEYADDSEWEDAFRTWTDWLKKLFDRIEKADEMKDKPNSDDEQSAKRFIGRRARDGTPITADEWFRSQPRMDRIWAGMYKTGRRVREVGEHVGDAAQ
ncbi:hypothetical protein DFH06DRAFT_1192199 [Mycena polygramma]|nr:hypothetical protein DFH06DRAFT_1192199 [Mycena polygramma]